MNREKVKLKQELRNERKYLQDILSNHLKTPLNAQILALDILLDEKCGNLNKEQKELLENISASNSHVLHIAENILSKYKTDENFIVIKKTTNIKRILDKVLIGFNHIISSKNHTIIVNCGILPLDIDIDEKEISRVLSNLILNAIDFSPKNSTIKIKIINKGDCLEFEIEDEGFGMDKKRVKNLFLGNIKKIRNLRIIGTGLGLYLSKKIILAHGGNIKVKKTGKLGTIIWFKLPLVH